MPTQPFSYSSGQPVTLKPLGIGSRQIRVSPAFCSMASMWSVASMPGRRERSNPLEEPEWCGELLDPVHGLRRL